MSEVIDTKTAELVALIAERFDQEEVRMFTLAIEDGAAEESEDGLQRHLNEFEDWYRERRGMPARVLVDAEHSAEGDDN